MIEAESARLAKLVDDLLDLSRIESGAVAPQADWCDLHDVVASAAAHASGDHPIEFQLPADLPLVRADAAQLERVFSNLIENAVKFSPSGRAGADQRWRQRRPRGRARRRPRQRDPAPVPLAGVRAVLPRPRRGRRRVRARAGDLPWLRRGQRRADRPAERAGQRDLVHRQLPGRPPAGGRRRTPSACSNERHRAPRPRRGRRAADRQGTEDPAAERRVHGRGGGDQGRGARRARVAAPGRARARPRAPRRPRGRDLRGGQALEPAADPGALGRRRRAGEGPGARRRRRRLRDQAVRHRRAAGPAARAAAPVGRARRQSLSSRSASS